MAGPPAGLPASVISSVLVTHRLMVAAAVFILYEYLITLHHELRFVWKSKLSPASALFISLRWTLLVEAIAILLPAPKIEGCSTRVVLQLLPDLLGIVQTATFSALRAFAISGRNRFIFATVLLLGLTPVVFNAHALVHNSVPIGYITKHIQQTFICNPPDERMMAISKMYALGGRLPMILAETIVIAVTWAKSYRVYFTGRKLGIPASLTGCLVRDGSFYFLVMLFINIASIVLMIHPNTGVISPVLDLLPPVLTARFIIDLRVADTANTNTASPSIKSVQFASRKSTSMGNTWASVDELGGLTDVEERAVIDEDEEGDLSALVSRTKDSEETRSVDSVEV